MAFVYKPVVYQRKSDKRWVGTTNLPHAKGERNRLPPVYGKTEKEVWEKLNPILFELQTGSYVPNNKDTLIEYLREYHHICAGYDLWDPKSIRPDKPDWAQTTAELYKMYIDVHFAPYFKDMKLTDILPMTLDKFYNYKMAEKRKYTVKINGKEVQKEKDPLSLNSVLKLNSFLSAAFTYAVKNEMIKKNPSSSVKLGKKTKYKPKVFNEDQFLSLLDFVEGTDDEIPIILGGGCGLRRGEIFGLDLASIDFKTGEITIKRTRVRFDKTIEKDPKNEPSSRTFKAPYYVMDVLIEYCKRTFGKITRSKLNQKLITRWQPGTYSERYGKLLKKFGLPHTRLHDLRHYNAVIMCKYGTSDKVAAERLGHAQVTTLRNVYQHVLQDMDQSSADGIDTMFEKKKERDEKKKSFKVIS